MKLTSILYVGIVATTFIFIGFIPGLVEIFENTFGSFVISSFATSWIFNYNNVMKVFKSKLFKNTNDIVIPFDYLMPMFNIYTFGDTFGKIAHGDAVNNPKSGEVNEELDFYFDYNAMHTEGYDAKGDENKFRNELFKLCFAKHNAGHFMWVYIASVVTILSTVAVM